MNENTVEELIVLLPRYEQFLETLNEDCDALYNEANAANDQRHRRSHARAVFAYYEGLARWLAELILAACKSSLSIAETAVLREESYEPKNNKAKTRDKWIPVHSKLPFVFHTATKHFELEHSVDTSGEEWRTFCRCVEVRHRVTHPKMPRDLDITDAEFVDMRHAQEWLHWQYLFIYIALCLRMGLVEEADVAPVRAAYARAEAETREMRADVQRRCVRLRELDEQRDRILDLQELCESKLARYRFRNR